MLKQHKLSEMQEKIDKLEEAVQYNVNALIESSKMTDICFTEKVTLQNELLDVENERD